MTPRAGRTVTSSSTTHAVDLIESVFYCKVCGEEAGRISLYRSGDQVVGSGRKGSDALAKLAEVTRAIRPRDQATLVVETFYGSEQQPVDPEKIEAVAKAIASSDAEALYRVSYSYAPFHCPNCPDDYCGKHWEWRRFKRFEDDLYQGGVEGTCPRDHFHVLSH